MSMRTIKFRGKDIETGEWLYGNIQVPTPPFDKYFMWDNDHNQKEVIPDTVGQFTSLLDKNDNEIYDGDILYFTIFDYNDHDTQHKGVVSWNSCTCYVECSEDEIYDLDWVCEQDCEVEIIGNIHDNPISKVDKNRNENGD